MIMRSNSPTKICPQARRFIFLPWAVKAGLSSRLVFAFSWRYICRTIFMAGSAGLRTSNSLSNPLEKYICFPWQYSSIDYCKPLISQKKTCPLAVHEENSRQRLHWPPTNCIGHQQELKVETSRAVQLISKVG